MSDQQSEAPFRARLPLPDLPITTDTRCFEVEIPNDPHLVGAFVGAINMLSVWTYWQRSENHAAIAAANVFKKILNDLEEQQCMGCKHTNPSFLPNLEPGEVREFDVTVEAGEFQLLPIILLPRQAITISDMVGQWRDSQYHPDVECTSNWETPLGEVINTGIPFPAETFITDVLPEVRHMKLIMRVNSCDVLSYHDLDDPITFTVPESANEDGVFVEFLANMPLDINNEVAPGFLGYGMVCFHVIVSDANYCPQVFIDFEEDPPTTYTLIRGTIETSSPIGEGAACAGATISTVSKEVEINIATEDCTARDYAFTYLVEGTSEVLGLSATWFLRREDGTVIDFGDENVPFVLNEVGTFTVALGSAPGVFSVNLQWLATSTDPFDTTLGLWIDNVFLN